MSMVNLRGVAFSYRRGAPVLKGITLKLERGEVAAVLGPNGAGKTTLLDICLGWKTPSAGTVLLADRPVRNLTPAERGRTVSLVPQRENVRFDFTVAEYVLLGRAPHLPPLAAPGRHDRLVAAAALREAGIARLAERSIAGLSGGEYQLMLIARSLAQQAEILLLDEPASQLDPAHQVRVLRLVRALSRKGICVLFTSHSPQAAATVADTVHLLRGGRFVAAGAPRAVLSAATLEKLYGVPFSVRWTKGVFSCSPAAP
jgi:iron complex transport system ATP-binding protein